MTKYVMRKKLNEYKAIILDMDGTLYYQMPLRIRMFLELISYYILHFDKIKELFELASYRKALETGVLTNMTPLIDYWMLEKPLKYISKFRDKKLLALLNKLQQNGAATLVVYSDYPARQKVFALNRSNDFKPDFVFCGGDIEIQCLKPDPKGLKHIIDFLKSPIEDMVFIGDRFEKDGKCAETAGMDYLILSKHKLKRDLFYNAINN